MSAADSAIQCALAQLGKPYKWGGKGPNEFDCSGLISYSYRAAGINLPDGTANLIQCGIGVIGKPLPGDLCFSSFHHVKLAISETQTVEATPGKGVCIAPMVSFVAKRRIVTPGDNVVVSDDSGIIAPITAPNVSWVRFPTMFQPQFYLQIGAVLLGGILLLVGLAGLMGYDRVIKTRVKQAANAGLMVATKGAVKV